MIAPKPNKDDAHICVDIRHANEAMQREKFWIPTVDEAQEEMNGSTVFSKLDMNMGFHPIEIEEGRAIPQHFQLVIHSIVTRHRVLG